MFPKIEVPQIIHFNKVFHYKPSILGVPLFFGNTYIGDTVDGRNPPDMSWVPVVNDGISSIPSSTGFLAGFLNHQEYGSDFLQVN